VRARAARRSSLILTRMLWAIAGAALLAAAVITATGGGAFVLAGVRVTAYTPTNALTASWLALLAGFLAGWRLGIAVRRRPIAWRPLAVACLVAGAVALLIVAPLASHAVGAW